jgi:hypothetical protein
MNWHRAAGALRSDRPSGSVRGASHGSVTKLPLAGSHRRSVRNCIDPRRELWHSKRRVQCGGNVLLFMWYCFGMRGAVIRRANVWCFTSQTDINKRLVTGSYRIFLGGIVTAGSGYSVPLCRVDLQCGPPSHSDANSVACFHKKFDI